jgi:glycosyltransferase involved in cell wall biosynthesis
VDLTVFTVGSSDEDVRDADALKSLCKTVHYEHLPTWRSLLNCLVALPTDQPLQTVYSWQTKLFNQLVREIKVAGDFDLVHVEHLRGSRYGVELMSRVPEMPLVWDSVDCISHLFKQASKRSSNFLGQVITQLELGKTQKAEGRLTSLFDRVLITSSADRDALIELVPPHVYPAPVSVLSNGVDLEYYQPNPSVARESATVVFSGKMSYHANISMALYLVDEIMPQIWAKRPEVRLVIVGKSPPVRIRKMAENPQITVTGTVADIRQYLWSATVSVVPLVYGAGVQNKILEAMATATPVVTTSKAISALPLVPGRDALVGDTPSDFASAVLRVIEDSLLQNTVGTAGLDYVKQHHNWNRIALQLIGVYEETIVAKKRAIGAGRQRI